jgi:hypothetical protein
MTKAKLLTNLFVILSLVAAFLGFYLTANFA